MDTEIMISEWQGTVTIKAKIKGEIHKLPIETLNNILEYLAENELVYGEKLQNDRTKTLLFDR